MVNPFSSPRHALLEALLGEEAACPPRITLAPTHNLDWELQTLAHTDPGAIAGLFGRHRGGGFCGRGRGAERLHRPYNPSF